MPDPDDTRIRDEAIAWHLRLVGANAEQWAQFMQWLESDPRHNAAYESVVDDDAFLETALVQADPSGSRTAANDDPIATESAGRKIWRWPALAAGVALVAGLAFLLVGGLPERYEVKTVAGETRTIVLEEGTAVMLNGGTWLEFDRNNTRFAELLSGEARFDVRHDAKDPFTVLVGQQRIVDAGTVFNLALDRDALMLDVAEGAVHYEGYGKAFDLGEGASLVATPGGDVTIDERPITAMAGWTRGELVYQGTTVAKVARDLQRLSGVSIAVSPDIAEQRFSGVIQTKGDREKLRGRLESLLGVRVTETDNGWSFEP